MKKIISILFLFNSILTNAQVEFNSTTALEKGSNRYSEYLNLRESEIYYNYLLQKGLYSSMLLKDINSKHDTYKALYDFIYRTNYNFSKNGNTKFAQNDDDWDSNFYFNGLDNDVTTIAVAPNGDIYVGGYFSNIGNLKVNYVAKYSASTSTWSALGNGVNGFVNTIAINGNDVYVGGYFSHADGIQVNGIAKWNGTNWSAIGDGIFGGVVYAIAFKDNEIYAGGSFNHLGNIAKWNGSSWSALGSGLDGGVHSISIIANNVYAGGRFKNAGTTLVNHVAKWDGNNWSSLGNGVTGLFLTTVWATATDGTNLYVGGFFNQAGSTSVNNIAKWDGTNWQPLGQGVFGLVFSIAVQSGNIYAGYGGTVSKWDGSVWTEIGIGSYTIYSIVPYSSDLIVGGSIVEMNDQNIKYLAKWSSSSSQWTSLGSVSGSGNGLNGYISTIYTSVNGNVYVGGFFNAAGNLNVKSFAKWDGNNWSSLGDVQGTVYSITEKDNELYVGGSFADIGGTSVNNIAKWNGNSWVPLGSGTNGPVYVIIILGNDLYVGGYFNQAGGVNCKSFAKWDGTNWYPVGDGVNGYILDLVAHDNNLYVGGEFNQAGTITANNIAKWDGNNWSTLGVGVNYKVSSLKFKGNDLYVGGDFNQAGGMNIKSLAKWDGTNWYSVSSDFDGPVTAINISGNYIYVGGFFEKIGTLTCNGIARWNGSTWQNLGSGVSEGTNPHVSSIAFKGTDVIVGGRFLRAGNKPSSRIAILHNQPLNVDDKIILLNNFQLNQNYPNPFNPSTKISWQSPLGGYTTLKIYDVLGNEVATLVDEYKNAGSYEVEFNAGQNSSLSSGVYFYKLQAGSFVQTKKMILTK